MNISSKLSTNTKYFWKSHIFQRGSHFCNKKLFFSLFIYWYIYVHLFIYVSWTYHIQGMQQNRLDFLKWLSRDTCADATRFLFSMRVLVLFAAEISIESCTSRAILRWRCESVTRHVPLVSQSDWDNVHLREEVVRLVARVHYHLHLAV